MLHIFAQGAPSHLDTWDPKPELAKFDGKSLPNGGTGFASPFQFPKQGKSGLEMSEVWPALSQHADKLAVIRSAYTDIPAHDQATIFMNTGSLRFSRPSVGAWVSYGLGTENRNLPGYVVLNNDWVPNGGLENFGSSFLPAGHQATAMRAKGVPVDNIVPGDPPPVQRRKLDLLDMRVLGAGKVRASYAFAG